MIYFFFGENNRMKKDEITICKGDNESNKLYQIRKKFIEELKPKNKKDLEMITQYSNILIDIVFLKCQYDEKTMKQMKKYLDKIKKFNVSSNDF